MDIIRTILTVLVLYFMMYTPYHDSVLSGYESQEQSRPATQEPEPESDPQPGEVIPEDEEDNPSEDPSELTWQKR